MYVWVRTGFARVRTSLARVRTRLAGVMTGLFELDRVCVKIGLVGLRSGTV